MRPAAVTYDKMTVLAAKVKPKTRKGKLNNPLRLIIKIVFPMMKMVYSQTCIKRPCIKWMQSHHIIPINETSIKRTPLLRGH